jgi:hypothetical protein
MSAQDIDAIEWGRMQVVALPQEARRWVTCPTSRRPSEHNRDGEHADFLQFHESQEPAHARADSVPQIYSLEAG